MLIMMSIRLRCSYCYYCGKRCYSGWGKIAGFSFKRGNNKEFNNPGNYGIVAFLSSVLLLAPIMLGILTLILAFSIPALLLIIAYCVVAFTPNYFFKEKTCHMCKQGQLGCPAARKLHKNSEKEEG